MGIDRLELEVDSPMALLVKKADEVDEQDELDCEVATSTALLVEEASAMAVVEACPIADEEVQKAPVEDDSVQEVDDEENVPSAD